jgi:hypothetical protein
MLRFRLKTLLASAIVVAFASIAWTLIPNYFWTNLSNTFLIENGDLVIFSSGSVGQGDPLLGGDPVLYQRFIYVPLWFVGSLAALGIAICVGAIVLVKFAVRQRKNAMHARL